MTYENTSTEVSQILLASEINNEFLSGLLTGLINAALFHPYDRTLFLAQANQRAFLSWINFIVDLEKSFFTTRNFFAPWQGLRQTIATRTFFGGVFFILQDAMQHSLAPILRQWNLSENNTQFGVGVAAGCIDGAIKSPVSFIKSYTWNKGKTSFLESAREILSVPENRLAMLRRGLLATIVRDAIYGGTYNLSRKWLLEKFDASFGRKKSLVFASNLMGGLLGTVACTLPNYVRTLHYATPLNATPEPMLKSIHDLLRECWASSPNYYDRLMLLKNRLCLGPGTIRVMLGMAICQGIYDYAKAEIKNPKITMKSDTLQYTLQGLLQAGAALMLNPFDKFLQLIMASGAPVTWATFKDKPWIGASYKMRINLIRFPFIHHAIFGMRTKLESHGFTPSESKVISGITTGTIEAIAMSRQYVTLALLQTHAQYDYVKTWNDLSPERKYRCRMAATKWGIARDASYWIGFSFLQEKYLQLLNNW